eukprot:m.9974 g.9974  ORF g.9974 m.9974 type:complete len:95 (-) comp9552_c0_seq1:25-309(-)
MGHQPAAFSPVRTSCAHNCLWHHGSRRGSPQAHWWQDPWLFLLSLYFEFNMGMLMPCCGALVPLNLELFVSRVWTSLVSPKMRLAMDRRVRALN